MMYALYRASKKTGKVDTALEGQSLAMLKLWALQNTTKTKQTIIMDEDNCLVYACKGTDDGFPEVLNVDEIDCTVG